MAITIRRVGPDDAEQYRICRLDTLRDAPTAFSSSFEGEEPWTTEMFVNKFITPLDTPTSALFGAFDGERLIGTTRIFREERTKRRHKMNLVGVYVRPEYRGQKISSALVEAAIAYARTLEGIESIELSVQSSNISAKALYASFGFKTWGTEPDFIRYENVYYDADYMSLKL